MAKILRTEQLSVDGDNIRLTATDGNLIINSVSGDDLTQITSTTKIGEDISSLAVRDTGFDADVSSLAANTSSVESMLVNVSKYGVYSLETSNLSTGTGSSVQTITLAGRAFVAKPTVTATLTGTANDPIIAVMISDVSETATTGVYQVTFQFSDELPATGETDQSTSYKLNILANVNAADQDLDTIVDSVDSDRDGDGMLNSLDYDPDDSSVGKIASVACADIVLHAQSPNQQNLASTAETFQLGSDTIIDNTNILFGESTYQITSDPIIVTDMSVTSHLAGTQDFTFETRFRTTDRDADDQSIFEEREVTRNRSVWNWRYRGTQRLGKTTGYFAFDLSNGDGPNSNYNNWVWTITLTSPLQIENNTWYHLAVVRQDVSNWAFYVNGVAGQVQLLAGDGGSYGSLSGSVPVFSGPTELFSQDYGTVTCNFQDFRITKKAIYSSNFTPPNSLFNNPC